MGRCWCLIFLLVPAACDRGPAAPPAPPRKAAVPFVEVTRLAPLPPDRRTHVTSNRTGQVYWVQEAERGRETVFVLSDGGLPSATRFTNLAILEALGHPGGAGSIQALAAGSDGKLYFYFSGGAGRKTLVAFGWFNPAGREVTVFADAARLVDASGLGASLALARGSIVWVGSVPWLWLRHPDGFALLPVDLVRGAAALRRPFERVRTGGELVLRPTSPRDDLSGGAGGLLYLDRPTATVWRIDPRGDAAVVRTLEDLPADVTAPQLTDDGGHILFAPDRPAFNQVEELMPLTTRPVTLPGLVIFGRSERKVLARDRFEPALRPDVAPGELVHDRSGWLMYDGQAGELIRLRVTAR